MNLFLILAVVAGVLNLVIGLAAFVGQRGFTVDLRHGPRRSDRRRSGGRREHDAVAAL